MDELTCPNCGAPASPDLRFCGACGSSLERTCPSCGQTWALSFRFCGNCGTPLASPSGGETGARRGGDPRGAQGRHGDLRGHQRVHRAGDPARPRGPARRAPAVLRRDGRGDRAVRRHGREVHRRRGDGRVRRPGGARGRRGASGPRRVRDAGAHGGAQPRGDRAGGRRPRPARGRQHGRGPRGPQLPPGGIRHGGGRERRRPPPDGGRVRGRRGGSADARRHRRDDRVPRPGAVRAQGHRRARRGLRGPAGSPTRGGSTPRCPDGRTGRRARPPAARDGSVAEAGQAGPRDPRGPTRDREEPARERVPPGSGRGRDGADHRRPRPLPPVRRRPVPADGRDPQGRRRDPGQRRTGRDPREGPHAARPSDRVRRLAGDDRGPPVGDRDRGGVGPARRGRAGRRRTHDRGRLAPLLRVALRRGTGGGADRGHPLGGRPRVRADRVAVDADLRGAGPAVHGPTAAVGAASELGRRRAGRDRGRPAAAVGLGGTVGARGTARRAGSGRRRRTRSPHARVGTRSSRASWCG